MGYDVEEERLEFLLTKEESRNYHELLYRLKNMKAVDWVKSYILAVVLAIVTTAVSLTIVGDRIIYIMMIMPIYVWGILFVVLFMLSVIVHSKNVVIKSMMKKYIFENLPRELDDDDVRLSKVKIVKNKLIIYYKKDRF